LEASTAKMKIALKRALSAIGAFNIIHRITAMGRVDIMLYHGFSEHPAPDGELARFMPIEQFESQIRLFVSHGKLLRLEDLLRDDPVDGIVVTIDDGYANNYHLAFPVLKKYGVPATIFITSGFVDRTTPLWRDWLDFIVAFASARPRVFEWRRERIPLFQDEGGAVDRIAGPLRSRLRQMPIREAHALLRNLETALEVRFDWDRLPESLRPLAWDEIRAMQRTGLVSFGSHTVSHPVLSKCSIDEQWSEITYAHRRLETELGARCSVFAYPYGKSSDYTEATKQLVAKAGCRLALSAESGFNTRQTDRHSLSRWGADISLEDLHFIIGGGPALSAMLGLRQSQ
jgi:peptidoglycan/xylan/chitin deacetylase (PgdA/CDA1 family)